MIGGEVGRPVRNSTGPGTPIPMPHRRPGSARLVPRSWVNSSSTRWSATSGSGRDVRRLVEVAEDPPVERRDRDVDGRRAEVRHEHMPGVAAERQLARRPAAGRRAGLALHDEPAVEQLGEPRGDDRPREARPVGDLGPRPGAAQAHLVEHRDERVEDLVGQGSGLGRNATIGPGFAAGAVVASRGRVAAHGRHPTLPTGDFCT